MQHVEIEEGRARWSWRVGALAVTLAIAGVAAFFLQMKLAGGDDDAQTFEPYTVGAMTLRAMVTSAGSAVAENEAVLSFQRPGQLGEILVELGDEVSEGQPLLRLDSEDAENAAATAASALALARLQLQKLEEGATTTEVAQAAEAVVAAQTGLTKAQNDLANALDPPTEAEMSAAEQAVAAAEANLAAAEAKLEALENGASDAEIAAAEAKVAEAETTLHEAERAQEAAEDNEDTVQGTFEYYAGKYCDLEGLDGWDSDVCAYLNDTNYEEPLTDELVRRLLDNQEQAEADVQEAAFNLMNASAGFKNAIALTDNADENVDLAQSLIDAAEAALDELEEGASNEDVDAAEQAVAAAELALYASQMALEELIDGATHTDIANLEAAVTKAEADVQAVQTAYNELIKGATATELAMQREQVHRAELELQQAQIALDDATLTSPFDGVVSSLPVKVGQVLNASLPAVTILTPGTLIFQLNVSETELASIRVGQQGRVIFDALPSKGYGVEVFAIGLTPEANQGVLVYTVKCKILDDTNVAGQSNPAPGMNGTANVVTQLHENVVAVPSAVVRARGGQQVVEVVGADGKIEIRPVTTGLTDGANIEILAGLQVGDTIAIRASAAAKMAGETPLPMGIQ